MLLATSCQKETNKTSLVPPPPVDPEECVQGRAVNNGDIIPGQYIVAYNNNVVNRMTGEESLVNTGADVLERNNIAETKMKQVFAGEPGGFVAMLSDAEALKLKNDPAVKIVEPDRVIALAGFGCSFRCHIGFAESDGSQWTGNTFFDHRGACLYKYQCNCRRCCEHELKPGSKFSST